MAKAGMVLDVRVRDPDVPMGRDLYLAGPSAMQCGLAQAVKTRGIDGRRLQIDSFGI